MRGARSSAPARRGVRSCKVGIHGIIVHRAIRQPAPGAGFQSVGAALFRRYGHRIAGLGLRATGRGKREEKSEAGPVAMPCGKDRNCTDGLQSRHVQVLRRLGRIRFRQGTYRYVNGVISRKFKTETDSHAPAVQLQPICGKCPCRTRSPETGLNAGKAGFREACPGRIPGKRVLHGCGKTDP